MAAETFKPRHHRARIRSACFFLSFFFQAKFPSSGKSSGSYETRSSRVCRFRASEHGDAFPPPPICRGKHGRSVLGDGNTCGQIHTNPPLYIYAAWWPKCFVNEAKEEKINSERNACCEISLEGSILARSIQLDRIATTNVPMFTRALPRDPLPPLPPPRFVRINAIPFRVCFWPRKDRPSLHPGKEYRSVRKGGRGFQFERAVPRNLRSSKTRKLGIGIRKFFSRCRPA